MTVVFASPVSSTISRIVTDGCVSAEQRQDVQRPLDAADTAGSDASADVGRRIGACCSATDAMVSRALPYGFMRP